MWLVEDILRSFYRQTPIYLLAQGVSCLSENDCNQAVE